MCYHHVKGPSRFKQRLFCGETVSADDLNYGSPRLCTACLREHPSGGPYGISGLSLHARYIVASCSISVLSVSGALPGSVQPCTNAGVVLTFDNQCGTC